jgi:DNA-binding NarL/FixJ family response regulator
MNGSSRSQANSAPASCSGSTAASRSSVAVEALNATRRSRPDVALLDLRMACPRAMDVVRGITGGDPFGAVKVVVVTTPDHDEAVATALRHGASGFLLRDAPPGILVEAVRAAVAGEALISPALTVRLLRRVTEPGRSPAAAPSGPLTARELDTIRLVARGLSNVEIAEELFVSLSTVKSHVSRPRPSSVRNRVQVAVWAGETGEADAPSRGRGTPS